MYQYLNTPTSSSSSESYELPSWLSNYYSNKDAGLFGAEANKFYGGSPALAYSGQDGQNPTAYPQVPLGMKNFYTNEGGPEDYGLDDSAPGASPGLSFSDFTEGLENEMNDLTTGIESEFSNISSELTSLSNFDPNNMSFEDVQYGLNSTLGQAAITALGFTSLSPFGMALSIGRGLGNAYSNVSNANMSRGMFGLQNMDFTDMAATALGFSGFDFTDAERSASAAVDGTIGDVGAVGALGNFGDLSFGQEDFGQGFNNSFGDLSFGQEDFGQGFNSSFGDLSFGQEDFGDTSAAPGRNTGVDFGFFGFDLGSVGGPGTSGQDGENIGDADAAADAGQADLSDPGADVDAPDTQDDGAGSGRGGMDGLDDGVDSSTGEGQGGIGDSGETGGDGGGGGGGGKVICTALKDMGMLDEELWKHDGKYGKTLPLVTREGYWSWGVPTALYIRKHKWAAKALKPVVTQVAKEMAYRVGYGKGSKIGKALLYFGLPLCNLLGSRFKKHTVTA